MTTIGQGKSIGRASSDPPRFSASGWSRTGSAGSRPERARRCRRRRVEFGAVGHFALAGWRPEPVRDVGPEARCPGGSERPVRLDRDPVPWRADIANICREWPRGWTGWPSFGRSITRLRRSMKRATSFSRRAGSAGRARNIPTSARSWPGSRGRGTACLRSWFFPARSPARASTFPAASQPAGWVRLTSRFLWRLIRRHVGFGASSAEAAKSKSSNMDGHLRPELSAGAPAGRSRRTRGHGQHVRHGLQPCHVGLPRGGPFQHSGRLRPRAAAHVRSSVHSFDRRPGAAWPAGNDPGGRRR